MARRVIPLTHTEVKNSKSSEKDYRLNDGRGLSLLIKTTGGKLWRFNYYKPFVKTRTEISLGTYPEISLAQAREERERCRALLAKNIDPQDDKAQTLRNELEKRKNTFAKVAEKWRMMGETKVKNREIQRKTLQKNWRIIEIYLFPTLENCPISEVTPKLAIQAIEEAKARDVSDTLRRAIRLLNEIMNFAVNADLIEFNKCTNIGANFSTAKTVHNPTIPPKELPAFLTALRDHNLSPRTKLLIKWQLLTMTRPSEAAHAQWNEIDFEAKTWTIPATKMKMGRPHIIPLSTQAIAILRKMQRITWRSPYVFQSETKPKQPMNSQTANRAIGVLGYKGILTAHGMRAIASTYLNEQLVNYDVVEACLAHVIQDQTRKLMSIVPSNTGGFGNTREAAEVFFFVEIETLKSYFEQLNDWLGKKVISYKEFKLLKAE